jgi:hypothetical protein
MSSLTCWRIYTMSRSKLTAFIVRNDKELEKTFQEYGYETTTMGGRWADFIVFNRKDNVMPLIYGHTFGVPMNTNKAADYRERDIWEHWIDGKRIPAVGVGKWSTFRTCNEWR